MKYVRLALDQDPEVRHPMHQFVVAHEGYEVSRLLEVSYSQWGDVGDGFGVQTALFHVTGSPVEPYEAALQGTDEVIEYELSQRDDGSFYLYVRGEHTDADDRLVEAFSQQGLVLMMPVEFRADGTMRATVIGPGRRSSAPSTNSRTRSTWTCSPSASTTPATSPPAARSPTASTRPSKPPSTVATTRNRAVGERLGRRGGAGLCAGDCRRAPATRRGLGDGGRRLRRSHLSIGHARARSGARTALLVAGPDSHREDRERDGGEGRDDRSNADDNDQGPERPCRDRDAHRRGQGKQEHGATEPRRDRPRGPGRPRSCDREPERRCDCDRDVVRGLFEHGLAEPPSVQTTGSMAVATSPAPSAATTATSSAPRTDPRRSGRRRAMVPVTRYIAASPPYHPGS